MSISQMFEEFIDNLAISNKQTISDRYAELTKTLNKQFRNTDSETANTLQVGSFGRKTGINGISDLDMLYIMPKSSWDTYKNAQNGQYKLLSDTKEAILNRYSRTAVSVDRLVVTVTFILRFSLFLSRRMEVLNILILKMEEVGKLPNHEKK